MKDFKTWADVSCSRNKSFVKDSIESPLILPFCDLWHYQFIPEANLSMLACNGTFDSRETLLDLRRAPSLSIGLEC
ncbi:hypothetical protein DSM25558_3201 [Agrobacterium sp. DSM 25558]|nr:hypothetical protein DSM25558_3201 [Agrobacterium sp. DSM 25558]